MHVSSRLTTGKVLAFALVLTLAGFGSPILQAQNGKKSHGCACAEPQAQSCPQTLREKPTAPPAETCCPVDPKEVKKAQKEADHAQHEAAEACRRQQRAAMKAQHKIDEAYKSGTSNVEAANAKLEQRKGESAEATAKLESLQAPNEGVAQARTETESSVMRSKPEPIQPVQPAPSVEAPVPPAQPAPSIEQKPSTSEAAPTPAPSTAPSSESQTTQPMNEQAKTTPKELPKTGSPLELLGLIGLLSSISGYATRFFRG